MRPLTLWSAVVSLASFAVAQSDQWDGTGSDSFYWHNRYHGCLAMSAYGDYGSTCPQFFTYRTLQRQYPGNTNDPFEIVGTFGPTDRYRMEGYMVRVPEMNKIVMVFKGQYHWQQYPADMVPFTGVGCDDDCYVHRGALEAWREIQDWTNDMEAIKRNQGGLVWSAAGHGWGGMVLQVAAMDLKYRGLLYSAQSFGAPAVFNGAAAANYDYLMTANGDETASMRTVANSDSVPAELPLGDLTMVNTGIHVYGWSGMYGQEYTVCQNWPQNPDCLGGDVESDNMFYFTRLGQCCQADWTNYYDNEWNQQELARLQAAANYTYAPATSEAPSTSAAPSTSSAAPDSSAAASSDSTPAPASSDTFSASISPNNNNVVSTSGASGVSPLPGAALVFGLAAWTLLRG